MRKAAGFPPIVQAGLAERRHEDGVSCVSTAAIRYDANGSGRWCVDCGAELGEQSWHPDGGEVPAWFLAVLLIVLAAIAGLAFAMVFLTQPTNWETVPGPSAVPTTYGPPPGSRA